MNIIISGKQMDLTSGIKGAIEEKIGRLDYYLHPETEVKVTVSAKKARHTIEVTIIPISGPRIGTAAHIARINESIRFDSVDLDNENDFEDEDENLDIVIKRNKKFDMKPMSPEEAVLQMELIEHEFYMFRNIDTDEISVVYKRENGGYGMIEHE